MVYEKHPDGRVTWRRAERLSRGDKGLARTPFKSDPPKRPKRNYSKRLGSKKPEPGSWKDLADTLESLLAKRVKMRDGFQCVQCRFDGAPTRGLLDAGHIYPKGKYPGGKYLIENLAAQCREHNTRHIARPEFMFLWYEAEHGPGSLERLHALVLAQPRRQSVEWMRSKIQECEEAIAELELLAVA